MLTPYLPREAYQGVNPATLPLLLVLPGVEGSGVSALKLAPKLATKFDVKALVIPRDNRQDITSLVATIKVGCVRVW